MIVVCFGTLTKRYALSAVGSNLPYVGLCIGFELFVFTANGGFIKGYSFVRIEDRCLEYAFFVTLLLSLLRRGQLTVNVLIYESQSWQKVATKYRGDTLPANSEGITD